ncbi:MAG: hypothetical protein QF599_09625 [Planctomycetota bacterium]|nr:hypothetical protein [Planctomycetota bacterium]
MLGNELVVTVLPLESHRLPGKNPLGPRLSHRPSRSADTQASLLSTPSLTKGLLLCARRCRRLHEWVTSLSSRPIAEDVRLNAPLSCALGNLLLVNSPRLLAGKFSEEFAPVRPCLAHRV